jgi:CspA family cold shock protein
LLIINKVPLSGNNIIRSGYSPDDNYITLVKKLDSLHNLSTLNNGAAQYSPTGSSIQNLANEEKEVSSMATGKVKWFNNAKGFGFIREDGRDEDIFAHYSTISMDGYRTLKAGQDVTFDLSEGPKGLHAINISLPSTDADE